MDSPDRNFGETSQKLMHRIDSSMKKAWIVLGLCLALWGVSEICRGLGLSSPKINPKPDEITAEITAVIVGIASGLLLLAQLVVDCAKTILAAVREKD